MVIGRSAVRPIGGPKATALSKGECRKAHSLGLGDFAFDAVLLVWMTCVHPSLATAAGVARCQAIRPAASGHSAGYACRPRPQEVALGSAWAGGGLRGTVLVDGKAPIN